VFSWTEEKNQLNKKKHGFYLSDILDVFDDPHLLEIFDAEHSSIDEDRYISIGRFHNTVILFVVTVDKANGNTQIISAREASSREQEVYHDHYRQNTNSSRN
jgi:uncharacterized DUF497 family protein